MNILILTPYIPYPINSGGNQGVFALINHLRNFCNISIVLKVNEEEEGNIAVLKSLWENVNFFLLREENKPVKIKKRKSYYQLLSKIENSIKRKRKRLEIKDILTQEKENIFQSSLNLLSSDYINFVSNILETNHFDIIEVDFFELITIIDILPVNIKKIFIHHELRFVRVECLYNLDDKMNLYDSYELNYLKKFELRYLSLYDGIVVMSEIDKKKLEIGLQTSHIIEVSPPVINWNNIILKNNFKFNNTLIFLGGNDHFPNYDAVNWFLNNCWNKILKQNPNLKFKIIGKWNNKIAQSYIKSYPNITFSGFVDDLSAELNNSIMLVPIRIGSGVRIKILEAVNHGCPLLTTSIGVEGIDLINEEECLIANDPEKFIDSVLRLTRNNELCNTIRHNAKYKIGKRANPESLAKIRFDIYKKILELPI